MTNRRVNIFHRMADDERRPHPSETRRLLREMSEPAHDEFFEEFGLMAERVHKAAVPYMVGLALGVLTFFGVLITIALLILKAFGVIG